MVVKQIREYKELYNAKIYHWVLMGNHYHLLLEISFDELPPLWAAYSRNTPCITILITRALEHSGRDDSRARPSSRAGTSSAAADT
jgi:hypothetical protein